VKALQAAFSLFQTRVAYSLYSAGNIFMFGLLASPVAVGIYAGAEKIVRASMSALFEPITRALFPRVSNLLVTDTAKATKLVRIGLATELSAGLLLSLLLFTEAPWLVRIILGEGYESSVILLRMLALLPPILAISTVLGHHWMLSHGMDRAFSLAIWCAAGVSIAGLLLLVPMWGAKGMVISSIIAESILSIMVIAGLIRKGLLRKLFLKKTE
jgi:PST family polysaccharide transporter